MLRNSNDTTVEPLVSGHPSDQEVSPLSLEEVSAYGRLIINVVFVQHVCGWEVSAYGRCPLAEV